MRLGLGAASLLAMTTMAYPVWGQAAFVAPSGSVVELRFGAVEASNQGVGRDPRLVALHKQFETLFPFSSYRLIREEKRRVVWGRRADFLLPGKNRYMIVIPREYRNGRVAMQVVVIEESRPVIDTVLALRNHGNLLVGGLRRPDGALILSIGASTVP